MHTVSVNKVDQDSDLTKFWEVEEVSGTSPPLTSSEELVQAHYEANTVFLPNEGRYQVVLTRKDPEPVLGESKGQRFKTNEKSIIRKGTWGQFQGVVLIWGMLNWLL